MRYLLLSVLVVCVIGIMIPSAYGVSANLEFSDYESGDDFIFTVDMSDFIDSGAFAGWGNKYDGTSWSYGLLWQISDSNENTLSGSGGHLDTISTSGDYVTYSSQRIKEFLADQQDNNFETGSLTFRITYQDEVIYEETFNYYKITMSSFSVSINAEKDQYVPGETAKFDILLEGELIHPREATFRLVHYELGQSELVSQAIELIPNQTQIIEYSIPEDMELGKIEAQVRVGCEVYRNEFNSPLPVFDCNTYDYIEVTTPQYLNTPSQQELDLLKKAKAFESYGILEEASRLYGSILEICDSEICKTAQESKEQIDFRLSSDKDYFGHPDVTRNIIISNDAVYNARIGNYHNVLEHYDTIRWCSGCNGADYFQSAGSLLMIYRALDAIGENEKALEVVEQLIPTFEKMTQGWDSKSRATTMADLYTSKMISLYKLGEYQDILDYLGSDYVVLGSIFDGDPYWNGKVRVSTKIMQGAVYEKMGNMEKAQESYTKAREYEHRDLGYGTSTIIFDEQQLYKYTAKFFLKVEDFTLAEKYIQKITDSDTKKELLERIEYFEIVKPILRTQSISPQSSVVEEEPIKQQTTPEPVAEPEPMIDEEAMASSPTCGKGTVLKNGLCVAEQQTQQSQGGGCLIATAAFGSELAPQVQFLRELRDNTVLQTESGTSFMTGFNQFYYSFSPTIADYERENPAFKETVKLALTPLLTSLTLLQYADIDSESEMLGYGIGIILLNIGMYFVAPAVLIMTVRKRI